MSLNSWDPKWAVGFWSYWSMHSKIIIKIWHHHMQTHTQSRIIEISFSSLSGLEDSDFAHRVMNIKLVIATQGSVPGVLTESCLNMWAQCSAAAKRQRVRFKNIRKLVHGKIFTLWYIWIEWFWLPILKNAEYVQKNRRPSVTRKKDK